LSVAAHRPDGDNKGVEHLALVNSIAGTTMLVNYTTGETLGKKGIGQRDKGPGTVDGYAEPGTYANPFYTFITLTMDWCMA
jgi:hypothetical protein